MDDYISRGTFIADCEGRYCSPCKEQGKDANGVRCRVCWVDDMLMEVEDAPAADVEPVTVQEWISVKDRLPELGERVICTDGDSVFEQYRVEHSCVYGMWDRCGLKSPMQEVTHWMQLPEPPEEEQNETD